MEKKLKEKVLDEKILVCDKCLCASCWMGLYFCDEYKIAGVIEKSKKELLKLNLEHPEYILGRSFK